MNRNVKLQDLMVIASFVLLTVISFWPLFSGKVLNQPDIKQHKGMSHEIAEYQEKEGKTIHWTNSMFSGMPTYFMADAMFRSQNIAQYANYVVRSIFPGISGIVLIGLICFYILGRSLNISRWLSAIGSFAFMAGTFVITSLVAGHTSKINAYAYSPLILAGLILIFKKRPWAGIFCLSFGLAAQLGVNHLQITFYTFLLCLVYVCYEAVKAIRARQSKTLFINLLFSLLAVMLAIGVNYNKLSTLYQHSQLTIRGGNSQLDSNEKDNSITEDFDYATQWSYSPLESFTLLIADFMGGSSTTDVDGKQMPTYWGKMPFTSGPVYVGAVFFALFLFGIVNKSPSRWWVLGASLLFLLLAWGKYSFLYRLFYNHFPFFDNFRTPMMALLMIGLLWPLLAIESLNRWMSQKNPSSKTWKIGLGISLGVVILFGFVFSGLYSFQGAVDQQLISNGAPRSFLDELIKIRKNLLHSDSFRSFILIALVAASMYVVITKKIKANYFVILLAVITLLDLYVINFRYLKSSDYVSKAKFMSVFTPDAVDNAIDKDDDLYYRVYNVATNPFNDAITSYNHKSIGGYHAAKLQRYQDVITHLLSKNNRNSIDMLNTKYIIAANQEGQRLYQKNENSVGNAWFVQHLIASQSAKETMSILDSLDVHTTAVIEQAQQLPQIASSLDSVHSIQLTSYHPERLHFTSKLGGSQSSFAVFSDINYLQNDGDGWHAKIDGEEVPIYNTNYVLRGLEIPAGEHKIEFFYQKKAFESRALISKLFSAIIMLFGVWLLAAKTVIKQKNA